MEYGSRQTQQNLPCSTDDEAWSLQKEVSWNLENVHCLRVERDTGSERTGIKG